ncbi:hypothetical protein IU405_14085 [Polaribacter sp. BAL334]|uniref:DUF3592 domain-containing protein n=1 Tax=Polaribacter sp. BAL334 TaxID=1708178 RepID=UPI0018D21012|nr:DUF3592 domain-containing protein [Polaribacter sp. BAL334]MBG7613378.1 hypothetical protein [Polaribacter sp. BAL334]
MENNKNTFWFIFLMFIIILYVVYNKNSYQNEINNNKEETIGEIVDFHYSNKEYRLIYMYKVDNIEFENIISTRFFRCKDGTKGCVGKTFKVYYSSKNPEKSDIDLEEYNKFKE